MKKTSLLSAAALTGVTALVLVGCAGSGGGTASDGDGGDAAGRACVILPDSESSNRWEDFDRPYLQDGLQDAGFEVDIQNAQGDVQKYSTIADQQLTKGCGVMLLVDLDGAAIGVAEKAKTEGIPVIAYDRPFEGADFYVSFDNVEVGRMQGRMVVDGLEAAGKDPATAAVFYMGGSSSDGNAAMFKSGAVEVMEAAGITPAQEPPGIWDADKSATNFEQALTANGGKVDAVWAANDANAGGVIGILQKEGLTGVPISGQDAQLAALQFILTGWQTGTVWKPVNLEAAAAIEIAVALLSGETPTADQELEDGTPYVAVVPELVGPDQVKDVVAAGDADAADLCTGTIEGVNVADKCVEYGIQ